MEIAVNTPFTIVRILRNGAQGPDSCFLNARPGSTVLYGVAGCEGGRGYLHVLVPVAQLDPST